MAKFIQVTRYSDDNKVLMNIDKINIINCDEDGLVSIDIDESYISINESYEEVKTLLGVE